MAAEPTSVGSTPITADSAFGLLGNETRFRILQRLSEAAEPVPFSELRDRVGVSDSGRFNYHLHKLEGQFVEKTDGGYQLLPTGRRVIGGVLSGVLTEDPAIERIEIDRPCEYCGASIDVSVAPGNISMYCSRCPGTYGESHASGRGQTADRGYLGRLTLPPAGFQHRSPEEIYRAAQVWGHLEILSIANAVCPRCSAPLGRAVKACEDHAIDDGLCGNCGNRYPIAVTLECTNCIFAGHGGVGLLLFGHPAVQAFKVGHGENLVAPTAGANPLSSHVEELLSTDPFAARVTYRYEDDAITLSIDDDLDVGLVTDPSDEQ